MLSAMITFANLMDGYKDEAFPSAFAVVRNGNWAPQLKTYVMQYIFTTLWTLLLIVPGIIKSYSYALAPYIVNDLVKSDREDEVSWTSAISESKELMQGHKMELFMLNLSFIGWYLLIVITFGLAALWAAPYIQTTKANFYRQIADGAYE